MDIQPYQSESLNILYNSLFCDIPEGYQSTAASNTEYPWDILLSDKSSEVLLLAVATDDTLESRVKLLACRKLAAMGHHIAQKELLGVVIEVGLEKGLDVIAAFKDGTARYINQSGKMIIWEAATAESATLINHLFNESTTVVSKIGPWNDKRLPAPAAGYVRLNFLVSDGLYFGQGPFDVLAADAMGGPVIEAALQLMLFLTDKVPA